MSNVLKDIWKSAYDNSAVARYRDANRRMFETTDAKELDYLNGVKNSALMSGVMSGIQGASGILNTSLQAAEIEGPTMHMHDIYSLYNAGAGNYYDFDQLGADRANANYNIGGYTADDMRGMTTAQKWGNIGEGALAGGQAGMSIAGPLGALAGGVVGGLGTLGGIIAGNNKAQRQAINLNHQADIAQQYAQNNFASAFENVADRKNRQGMANIAGKGGKFTQAAKAKHMTIQQFADSVLARQNVKTKKNMNKLSSGGDIYNTHGGYYSPGYIEIDNGGTHEQNPNGGVQLGVDPMGIPNLVEQGEIVYDDYVFSNRLKPTAAELKEFSLPENLEGLTFADVARKLGTEAKERINDPLSNKGMGKMLDRLIAAQDFHKQQQAERKLKNQLKDMSPEELMQLGTALAEVPQEEAMPAEGGMPVMAACGGKLAHKYDLGGHTEDEKKRNWFNQLTLAAMMAENPAVATASGWTYDENGNIVQTDQDTEGAELLRQSLAELSTIPLSEMGLGLAGQGIRALRGMQTAPEIIEEANQAVRTAREVANRSTALGKAAGEVVKADKAKAAAKAGLNTARQNATAAREEIRVAATKQAAATTAKQQAAAGKSLDKAVQKLINSEADAAKYRQEARRAGFDVFGKNAQLAGQKVSNTFSNTPSALGYTFGIGAPAATVAGIYSMLDNNIQGNNAASENIGAYNNGLVEAPMPLALVDYPQPLGTSGTQYVAPQPKTQSGRKRASSGVNVSPQPTSADIELNPDYAAFVQMLSDQRDANGKPTKAAIDAVKAMGYDDYNQWLHDATDGTPGPVHNRTWEYAQKWAARQRDPNNIAAISRPTMLQDLNTLNGSIANNNLASTPTTSDIPAGGAVEDDTMPLLPTGLRYAGVGYNVLSGIHNMLQSPDQYQYRHFSPATVDSDLSLDRLQYNPYDFNMALNQLDANAAATRRQIGNSGLGASTGAALLAQNYNDNMARGNAAWQTRLANQQQRAGVTQANNQAESAESDYDYRRDYYNTQTRNQYGLYNLQNAMQIDAMNRQAEAQKWAAVSQSLDAAAQDLSAIGNENFSMNMVNTNPALLYRYNPWYGAIDYKKPKKR